MVILENICDVLFKIFVSVIAIIGVTSVAVVSGSIIIYKLVPFRDAFSCKRFITTLHHSLTGCFITSLSTCCLKCTRFLDISEKYRIMSLLISILGSLKYRYELYCNRNDDVVCDLLWKSYYPWIMYCAAPSIFICGFKNEGTSLIGIQTAILISTLGILIGALLPNKPFMADLVKCFPVTGVSLIAAKLVSILNGNKPFVSSLHPNIDSFSLGCLLVFFGFLIEDVKVLKEKIESISFEDYFDELSSSIPIYIDLIVLYLFTREFVGPFCTLNQVTM